MFMQLKKKQVGISNQQEFTGIQSHLGKATALHIYHYIYLALYLLDDSQDICARVNSNRVTKGHITGQ